MTEYVYHDGWDIDRLRTELNRREHDILVIHQGIWGFPITSFEKYVAFREQHGVSWTQTVEVE